MTIATVMAIAQLRLRIHSLSRAAAPGVARPALPVSGTFCTFGTFGSSDGASV